MRKLLFILLFPLIGLGQTFQGELDYNNIHQGTFAVGATTINGSKASYSNWGDGIGEEFSFNRSVCWMTAPGSAIPTYNYNNSIVSANGTSFAAPHVTGVIALIASLKPNVFSNKEIRSILRYSVDDYSAYNPLYPNMIGYGNLNAYEALLLASTPNPDVSFTADIRRTTIETTIGTTISFTGSSTNSPEWTSTPATFSYVGGTTSASQNPKIQCTANGLYTVSLYVFNGGNSDVYTRTNYITITDAAYISGNTIMFSK